LLDNDDCLLWGRRSSSGSRRNGRSDNTCHETALDDGDEGHDEAEEDESTKDDDVDDRSGIVFAECDFVLGVVRTRKTAFLKDRDDVFIGSSSELALLLVGASALGVREIVLQVVDVDIPVGGSGRIVIV